MCTNTAGGTAELPSGAASVEQRPGKVTRIAAMIKQLHDEVHAEHLDAASRHRLRSIHARAIRELEVGLGAELSEELQRLALPLTDDPVPSDAELRIAQAQLMGWLEGLFHGIQTAVSGQQMAATAHSNSYASTRCRGIPKRAQINPSSSDSAGGMDSGVGERQPVTDVLRYVGAEA
jgi:hypothetical protein